MIRKSTFTAYIVLAIAIVCTFTACNGSQNHQQCSEYTSKETSMIEQGLVDISKLDSSIAVKLVYATPYNFMGKTLYHDISHAFMQPDAAKKLVKAHKILRKMRPDLKFIIYDAARPISIQHEMWNMVKDTDMKDFVSDPNKGQGMHNYGAAIDISLMDCTGMPIPMGSCYDYFGDEARVTAEPELIASEKITKRELEYRLLLRKVMTEAGFLTIDSEWWHFNLMTSEQANKSLKIVE